MIVFNVKADGTVDTLPSIVPQASSLADIVVLSAYDYAFCYLHLTPPSGVYIPDVVCTPVLTTNRKVTLWTAPMPAEATKIGGNVGYTIYFKAKDGTTQRTNPGTFSVPRTEISTVNEDGKFIKRVVTKDDDGNDVVTTVAVDETNYGEIYQVIADIYQAFVSLNREQLENTNLLEVLDDLLQGYNRDPDENRTGAVLASVLAVDEKAETNKKSIEKLSESTSKDIEALQTLTPSFGTITLPTSVWNNDEKTTSVPVSIPANTLRNGALMVIVPANDETKTIVAEQGMSMAVDATVVSESGDKVVFERMEGSVPDVALVFRYAVIYADVADAPAVTLVGGLGGGGGNGGVYFGSDFPPPTASIWIDPTGEPSATEPWEFDMDAGGTTTKRVVVLETTVSTVTNVEGGN